MSEDGSVTDEVGTLDDGFGRDLGADLGGGDRPPRRWGRRRRIAADEAAVDAPPPPASSSAPPPPAAWAPPPGPEEPPVEPAPARPIASDSPSDEALALVALLTGGKAPGSAEALKLAALLLGTEAPAPVHDVTAPLPAGPISDPPVVIDPPTLIDPPVVIDPPTLIDQPSPEPSLFDEDLFGSLDLPWLDPAPLDDQPLAPIDRPPPEPSPLDDDWLGSLDLPWLDPEGTEEEPAPAESALTEPSSAMPPPPTGERLATPEEIPPPAREGEPTANGHGPPGDGIGIFDRFGWPPPPQSLDDGDIRSLNETRPFPLPVGNHTAVHDLSALQAMGLDPGPTHLVRPLPPEGSPPEVPPETERRRLTAPFETGDVIFRRVAWAGGISVLVIMAVVGLFLSVESLSALRSRGWRFLTTEEWQPDIHVFGIAAVLFYTVAIAAVALVVAVPLATGTALFITEMAPRRLRTWFVAMVDLMAAVPSIVYGLWGLFFLQGRVIGLSRWLAVWLGWIPFFKVDGLDPSDPSASQSVFTASTFVAGLVVALMVIPISCSIMREVFSQAPPGEREGAFALGATRWGMVRTVVLPFGRGGMIGAIMLGLGRALGETIAVYLLISPVFDINWHVLQTGSNSVSTLIVLRQGDASGFGLSALMAAGLALFVMTLVVNFGASTIVARSRSGASSEA